MEDQTEVLGRHHRMPYGAFFFTEGAVHFAAELRRLLRANCLEGRDDSSLSTGGRVTTEFFSRSRIAGRVSSRDVGSVVWNGEQKVEKQENRETFSTLRRCRTRSLLAKNLRTAKSRV